MSEPNNNDANQALTFDKIRISLASPEKIRSWSRRPYMTNPEDGEVKKPETINYRTLKPEKDGLFCEKIFGPSKDWECHCGKYKKIRYKGVVCDRCGVEVTKSSVRRERMGRIELAAPVSHIWYFKGIPSRMGLMLELTPKALEKVLYFAAYIVLKPGNAGVTYKQILNEGEYREAQRKQDIYKRILNDDADAIRRQEEYKILSEEEYKNARENHIDNGDFEAGMGAEAIQKLLAEIDLDEEAARLREELKTAKGQKATKIVKKLEAVEAFRNSGNRPEWMILNVIPVIPPDLRPMVQLDGGRFATSDLNDLYRRILNRNNRLQRLKELAAPDIIVRNEKRMLQEAVDALIDNGRRGRPVTGPGNRALKSLSDMLKGKQGRFRQNLLGKRVDYSGRSVIVVGPELKIYQCGLPKEMAIELFKPFVMKELQASGKAPNIKAAKKMVERLQPEVWDVLEEVIHEHPVMLNRAPTLHRLGIQAFEPILVEGKAIKLHPLVCTAFNADFDGDQMAVHLPLSVEAQSECRFMLLSPNNLLKPSDGGPVAVPTQDMVLGIYYLTQEREADKTWGTGKFFGSKNEAILAYENGYISLHARIRVRMTAVTPEGKTVTGTIETTLGRILFNEIIPQDLGFVERKCDEDYLKLEIDFHVSKKHIKSILEKVINVHGATRTAEVLDDIKSIGYKYSTKAAMTVSISDMTVPPQKKQILDDAQAQVEQIAKNYRRGFSTEEERYNEVINTWKAADAEITDALLNGLDKYNNIFMMADSGARGSDKQIKQLAGMRGLMADTTGRTIELPIKSNFREGLDVLEYFISAHGARKGLSDTALRTADSGYLTRRLVDVSQDLIIREIDCSRDSGDIPYMEIQAVQDGNEVIESLEQRVTGRYAAEDVVDENGELIVAANEMITPQIAPKITKSGRKSVKIRTILSCRSHTGVCSKCYGANMATGHEVQVGEAVGIIAAQSIGEPGTQLTMRTFHTGGVAGDDITQGLPRVEELFEARKPKGLAIIAEFGGKVEIGEGAKGREIRVINPDHEDAKPYQIPFNARIKVHEGDVIEAGDELTEGSINPHDLLRIKGVRAVQDYMIREVQRVYRLQGVEINDKHIEVIVRQMLKKVKVDNAGDTGFLPGTSVDVLDFQEENSRIARENERLAAEYMASGMLGDTGLAVNAEDGVLDYAGENARVAKENERIAEENKQIPAGEPKKPLLKMPFLVQAEGKQVMLGITKASLATNSFLSAASFQETTKVLTEAAINGKVDPLIGLKENVIIGKLIPAGTGMKRYRQVRLNSDAAGFDVPEIPDDGSIDKLSGEEAAEETDGAAGHDLQIADTTAENILGEASESEIIDFSEEETEDSDSVQAVQPADTEEGAEDAPQGKDASDAETDSDVEAEDDDSQEDAGLSALKKLESAVAKVIDLEKKKDTAANSEDGDAAAGEPTKSLAEDDDDDFEPDEDQYVDLSAGIGKDLDDIIDDAAHADDYGDGSADE